MHIQSMLVGPGPLPVYTGDKPITCDEHVNVFIGPNGCGKTSLLRAIASAAGEEETAVFPHDNVEIRLSDDWAPSFEYPPAGSPFADYVQQLRTDPVKTTLDDNPWLSMLPCIFVPATRTILPGQMDWDEPVITNDEKRLLENSIDWRKDAHVFDSQWMVKIYKFLFDTMRSTDVLKQSDLLRTARIAHECASQIASEILGGRGFNFVSTKDHMILQGEDHFDPLSVEPYVHPGMGALARWGPNSRLMEQYVGDLSAGTQGALLWILYIGLRMMWHYDRLPDDWDYAFESYGKRWDQRPVVLLIDEIENHLHPTWQRRVIPALLEHFPGLQIFATTHSPFMVAGLKAGQVHVLKRDADGVVTATPNPHDIIGWTTDEILRTFMGVDEPTDQLTIDRRERLLELRRKDALTDEEAAEMEELRRQVNEDFLSSSTPLEAQRERYGDMMLEFLRSRQSELSQDGS